MIMHIPVWGEKFWNLFARNFIFSWTSKKRLFLPLEITMFTKYSVPKDFFHWLITFSMPYFIKFRDTKNAYIEKINESLKMRKHSRNVSSLINISPCHFSPSFINLYLRLYKKFKLKKNHVSITCNRKNCLIHVILHIKNVTPPDK